MKGPMESRAAQPAEPSALPRHDVDGNELTLIPGGEERLTALMALIESARERLDICYYIFTRDVCGERVLEALIDACNRGVAVTLLVDAFGSATTPQGFFDPLIEASARFGWFGAHRSTRYLIRNHQKMVIADGKRALIGGFNCDRSYFAPASDAAAWCDLGLMVKGPWAGDLERWFDALAHWTIDTKQRFRRLRQLVRTWQPGEGAGIWVVGGPTRQLNNWVRKVKADLEAGQRLDLVAAYFSPSPGMIRRINRIARRDGARLIAPSKSDNTATIGAARHLYRRLLRAGVRIFEYRPQKLHMKLIVIDDVTYVGSANFDMRSLFLNLELMLRIEDAGFAVQARGLIDTLEADSRRIDGRLYDWMAGPVARVRWWLQYLLVGVLDYTVTRRLNFRRRR
jgi:cardiolipin synthase